MSAMTEHQQLGQARELLEIFRSTLGTSREMCSPENRALWDRITEVLEPGREITHHLLLGDRATSFWLKGALMDLVMRDPLDPARDAELLSMALRNYADTILYGEARGFALGNDATPHSPRTQ